jgi:hypothetical protein
MAAVKRLGGNVRRYRSYWIGKMDGLDKPFGPIHMATTQRGDLRDIKGVVRRPRVGLRPLRRNNWKKKETKGERGNKLG